MKTHSIIFETALAILVWHPKSKRVAVRWFYFKDLFNGQMDEVTEWPEKETTEFICLENVLRQVRKYVEQNELTLWSY